MDCSLAELAECADVLSFGGTKNGAMGAEALIVMRSGLAADAPYLRKQQTQLTSKMRFVAAQFNALLHDDLWRANAAHANAMARRLAAGASAVDGVEIVRPVQANAVFARLHPRHIAALQRDWTFHLWDERSRLSAGWLPSTPPKPTWTRSSPASARQLRCVVRGSRFT